MSVSQPSLVVDVGRDICGDFDAAESREWLVANGIGGFASGTIAGTLTRRYHGFLVAALAPHFGRTLLVSKIDEEVRYATTTAALGTNRWASGAIEPAGYRAIEAFRLEGTTPVWTFAVADALVEKRVWMEHGRNVTYVEYRVVRSSGPLHLTARVLVNYRDFHGSTHAGDWHMETSEVAGAIRVLAYAGAMPIWIATDRGSLNAENQWYRNFALVREADRGLDSVEDHLLAASLDVDLAACGDRVTLVLAGEERAPSVADESLARCRSREATLLAAARAATPAGAPLPPWIERLVLAADQFATSRAGASMIAGYPWFGSWSRDTMIALPGIALATGRAPMANEMLRTFAAYLDAGMLPNFFPDSQTPAAYNTVDASLWLVDAVRAYDDATGDRSLARDLFASLSTIVDAYEAGTRYRIHMDRSDGLIFAGEPGVQLTWMDAKVGDSVVTPRIGKPIEINALWYNALRILESFATREGNDAAAKRFAGLANVTAAGFERFWNASTGTCYDVVDGPAGDDPSCRPNQLFAASLPYRCFDLSRRRAIVATCGFRLVTSYGLRSLAPDDPHYRGTYGGDVAARDGAYHQGTVWGWLVGPWVAALLHCGVSAEIARSYLEPYRHQLQRYGLGTLAEIADGDAPFAPNGCIAQAWTVAAVLSAWQMTNH